MPLKRPMRKGTRSCTACRRRKVGCSYPSDQASKCVHCVRRGSTCVPQGEDIDVDIEVPASAETIELAEERERSEGEEAFFEALKGLRQSIAGLSAREPGGRDTGRSELLEMTARQLSGFSIMNYPSFPPGYTLTLALSTGEHARYIPVVERYILNDDELASGKYGFQCLMALGLCLLSSLQPRRAWTVYRRANTLLQLHGIHRRHRENAIYSVLEALCDLYIPSAPGVDGITAVEYHYRHLSILTGRIIDCPQSLQGPSLSGAVSVEERIDEVTGHLPPRYVDLSQLSLCPDYKEKYTRAFRLANIHQLKAFLYLPFFLNSPGHEHGHDRQGYGRTVCVHSARTLLEAYLVLYESDPDATSIDNAFILSSLTALTAAVIMFLDLIGERHTSQNKNQRNGHGYDEALINRTITALRGCAGGMLGSLCGQCCTALETLLDSTRAVGRGRGRVERKEVRRIVVPYFGVVSIERKDGRGSAGTHGGNEIAVPSEEVGFDGNGLNLVLDDLLWAYQGPWMGNDMGVLPDEGNSYATFDLTNDFWQPR
ncbi:hypothetical protein SI65_00910 [Aspergillus cristatus]|uniref:Zn(2)-C6 fungal-type domain-containing protein n=1 Tax=Aspergillus cristatus TaxID=573508 RepID=A0A1E3BRB4_ASPCR|nr:hypothetical protein SI65_00910 [Aspergillus cristatus]